MGPLDYITMALAGILNFFMPVSMMIDRNCDYHQETIVGQNYFIYNSEYPGYYGPSTSCRWVAHSQPGTKIVLACEVIELPKSTNCNGDRLSVSLTGDINFANSQNYCGTGSVTLISASTSMSIGLFSTQSSQGGRFMCTLTSIVDNSDSTTKPPNVCDCGWNQDLRIVGGNETKINEFPSMAGLIDVTRKQVFCGGSIISDRYVLTAGHCLWKRAYADMVVLVGDHNITTGGDTPYAAVYPVNAYEIHPDYNNSNKMNDIGIIQTKSAIKFSLYVGPICLPFRYTTYGFTGQQVTALGWGQTEFSGPSSDVLLKVDLTVTTNIECSRQNQANLLPSQMCTFAESKDACQGDSGGPLLWKDTGTSRLQLAGIISYGLGCGGDLPGINSRVTSFLSWIVSRTSDARYCIK